MSKIGDYKTIFIITELQGSSAEREKNGERYPLHFFLRLQDRFCDAYFESFFRSCRVLFRLMLHTPGKYFFTRSGFADPVWGETSGLLHGILALSSDVLKDVPVPRGTGTGSGLRGLFEGDPVNDTAGACSPGLLRNLKKNRHIMRQCYFSVGDPDISIDQFIANWRLKSFHKRIQR